MDRPQMGKVKPCRWRRIYQSGVFNKTEFQRNIIIYLSIRYDMNCSKKNNETRLKQARILPDPLNDV